MKRPGKIIELPDGSKGRTFNDKPPINGKIAVYDYGDPDSKPARLFAPQKLKVVGFID